MLFRGSPRFRRLSRFRMQRASILDVVIGRYMNVDFAAGEMRTLVMISQLSLEYMLLGKMFLTSHNW